MEKKIVNNTINDIQEEIIKEFINIQKDGSGEDILYHIIEMGRQLSPMPEEMKTSNSTIHECMSKVWISFKRPEAGVKNYNKMIYFGDSDSEIVKGIIALLFRIFNNQSYEDIIEANLFFIEKISLISFLGQQRAFGFATIVKKIKMIALLEQSRPRRGRPKKK